MKKIILIFSLTLSLFATCKKNKIEPKKISDYTKEELKSIFVGKWKIHYFTGGGGLGGGSATPTYLNNSIWTFTNSDSLFEKIENWNNAGKIKFIRTNLNEWQISDEDPNQITNFPINWIINDKKGDTIIATYNSSNAPTRYMTKIP